MAERYVSCIRKHATNAIAGHTIRSQYNCGQVTFLRSLTAAVLLASLLTAETLQQWEQRARELKAKGDAAGALAAYEEAAKLAPRSARLQDEAGFLLAVLNRNVEAIAKFQRAIELDAKYAPAHYHLGVAYWLGKETGPGTAELQAAVRLGPRVF